MMDLGILKYFLGIEDVRGPNGFVLYQHKYALDIITETCHLGSRPTETPLEQNISSSCTVDWYSLGWSRVISTSSGLIPLLQFHSS